MTTILAFLLYSFVLLLSELTRRLLEFSQRICEKPSERVCPTCSSEHLIKNGSVHNKKPKYQCKGCGRQFVVNPTKTSIPKEIKLLIDRLLLERISLRGIARVTQVSWSWLQDYVNQKLAQTPCHVNVSGKSSGKLTIECDELWSFVDSKKNEVYVWLAMDRNSRKIVGCFVGDRTRKSPRKLWASLPEVYQQCAFAYTDFWQAYKTVISPKRHRAVGKETGLTNHIERLNNTFRQRVSRAGKRKSVILQKAQQPHWSYLVLHSWLQCRAGQNLSLTTTSISLPKCYEPDSASFLALSSPRQVATMRDGHATVKMDEVQRHLNETRFAWIGGTEPNSVFYYRIYSPVILIEFDHQTPIALRYLERGQPTREHIYTVVRTPNGNDYGKDLLRQHYQQHPHPHRH